MENEKEVKAEEVSEEEVQSEEQVVEEQAEETKSEEKEERPEKNYKAELARKNAEIERLRTLASAKPATQRDPNDLATWQDHELKAVIHSNDPAALALKSQAEDILMDRRVAKVYEKRMTEEKKVIADVKLRKDYPEALDPTSDFALKMEEVMQEFDLSKSPAGRLAAAKIVASEMNKGSSNASAKERKAEADRVARVKGQMVDGDRSKSVEIANSPKKQKDLEDKVMSEGVGNSDAFSRLLHSKGLSRDKFFKDR